MDTVDPSVSGNSGASRAEQWAVLVEAVATRQDREAFTTLFDYFAPRIEAHLQRLGLDVAQAEEIAQDVMVTLWRKASLFDPAKSSLSTWLYRIARNRRIDLSRRDRTDYVDPQSATMLDIPSEGRIDQAFDAQQRDDIVRVLVLELPPEQIRLVQLAFYEGLSHSQIAERTSIPLGTVKSRLRLAFTRLRRKLEAQGVDESR
ncbi:RpoE DNA-directed RNA polymerase specialized sigma subunit, sigma24 homolog [Rhabdaerophilaceae bacterium]